MNLLHDNSIAQTKETQNAISPSEALEMLKEGNNRFIENNRLSRDLNAQQAQTGSGQFPFAAIVGCIDSRVPAEIVFDQGIGDLFNARIAGNFVNKDILGSLEFACKVAGAKAIVVLGHTSCGAVKGACADVKLGNLTHTLENIKPAVEAVANEMQNANADNPEFIQKVAEKNVELTVQNIKEQSEVLREMNEKGEIEIVGGIYDVETGKVTF